MAINPFNDLELIAIGNSQARNDTFQRAGAAITMADGSSAPLWRSADGGATWSAVPLSSPSADGSGLNINSLYYSQVGGAWVVEAVTASATPAKTVVWRGAAGVAAAPLVLPGGTDSYIGSLAIDGQGGDTWIANAIADGTGPYAGHKIAYLAAEASALTVPAGAGAGVGMGYGAALLPGTRRVVALTGGGALWGTIDYRAAQPVSLGVSVGAGFLAALSDGSVIVASSSGIYVIADPFGAATVGVPITDAASRPVTDAASRTVAAVRLSGGYALYGDAWQTVLDPPGVALFAADVRRREDA
jgi:hypothetical protein